MAVTNVGSREFAPALLSPLRHEAPGLRAFIRLALELPPVLMRMLAAARHEGRRLRVAALVVAPLLLLPSAVLWPAAAPKVCAGG